MPYSSTESQNLLPNPGFDSLHSGKYSLYPWTKINTIDFFLENESAKVKKINRSLDKNFTPRKARSFPAYIGIRIQPDYREFIQLKLPSSLIKGHHYFFEMYVTPSPYCKYLLQSIGVSFYERKNAYAADQIVGKFPPQLNFIFKKGIKPESKQEEWVKLSGEYIANGDEKFISIGNFSTKKSGRIVPKKNKIAGFANKLKEAYIYIDDILLKDLDTTETNIIAARPDTSDSSYITGNYIAKAFETGNSFVLNNIFFKFNSAELLPESYDELQLLLEYMNDYPSAEINITGHTDSTGTASYNMKLSTLRAKSVYDFLINNQISQHRLSYCGRGFTEPAASNSTPEGRQKNRRVEISLKKPDAE